MSQVNVDISDASPSDPSWIELSSDLQPQQRFATSSWFSAWGSVFLPMDRWIGPVSWLVARDHEGRSLANIPIARQRWPGFTVHSLGGYYWPFRTLPITSDPERLHETCRAIATFASSERPFAALRLGPVPRADPIVISFLDEFARSGWIVLEKRIGETLAIHMPATFESFEKELGSHLLKKVSYFERRLRKLGDFEIRQSSPTDAAQWNSTLDDLSALEGNSWVAKQTNGVRKFLGDRNRRFWEEVVSSRAVSEALCVWIIYSRNIPVSYSLNVESGDTRYILANGYDDAYKEHSTGTVLAYHLLRNASERGIKIVEWGLGDSGYKSRWQAIPHHELADLVLIPTTLKSALQAVVLTKFGHYRSRTNSQA